MYSTTTGLVVQFTLSEVKTWMGIRQKRSAVQEESMSHVFIFSINEQLTVKTHLKLDDSEIIWSSLCRKWNLELVYILYDTTLFTADTIHDVRNYILDEMACKSVKKSCRCVTVGSLTTYYFGQMQWLQAASQVYVLCTMIMR